MTLDDGPPSGPVDPVDSLLAVAEDIAADGRRFPARDDQVAALAAAVTLEELRRRAHLALDRIAAIPVHPPGVLDAALQLRQACDSVALKAGGVALPAGTPAGPVPETELRAQLEAALDDLDRKRHSLLDARDQPIPDPPS
jgi:hypothetical protein